MIDSIFQAAMTDKELLDGEARHLEIEQSRKLAMAVALTKSSDQLRQVWESDPETYKTLLKGVVAAYEHNALVEELLRGAVARLVCVVGADQIETELVQRCTEITTQKIGEGGTELF